MFDRRYLFIGLILIFSGNLFSAGFFSDVSNVTLRKPEAASVRNKLDEYFNLDKQGILLLSITSDKRLHYELWTGIKVIERSTLEKYSIKAIHCYTSQCFYIGKLPVGEYFIDTVYHEKNVANTIHTEFFEIRNVVSHFKISPHKLTDLGLMGIYQAEAGDGKSGGIYINTGSQDNVELFEYIYARGLSIMKLLGDPLTWEETDQLKILQKFSMLSEIQFTDFTNIFQYEGMFYFPTALGHIYHFDKNDRYHIYKVNNSRLALYGMYKNKGILMAGGEAGVIARSMDNGKSWSMDRVFSINETVVRIYEHEGALYYVCLSGGNKIRIYRSENTGKPRSVAYAQLKFLKNSFFVRDQSHKMRYIDRIDIRDMLIKKLGDRIFVSDWGGELIWYDLKLEKWSKKLLKNRVRDIVSVGNKYLLLTREDSTSTRSPKVRVATGYPSGARGGRISRGSGVTEVFESKLLVVSNNLEKIEYQLTQYCIPRSGLLAFGATEYVALSSCYEYDHALARAAIKRAGAVIYALGDAAIEKRDLISTEGITYYMNVAYVSRGDKLYMIDRLTPKIFEVDSGKSAYKEYGLEGAFLEKLEIKNALPIEENKNAY